MKSLRILSGLKNEIPQARVFDFFKFFLACLWPRGYINVRKTQGGVQIVELGFLGEFCNWFKIPRLIRKSVRVLYNEGFKAWLKAVKHKIQRRVSVRSRLSIRHNHTPLLWVGLPSSQGVDDELVKKEYTFQEIPCFQYRISAQAIM